MLISIYSSRFAENCCCIFAFYKKEEYDVKCFLYLNKEEKWKQTTDNRAKTRMRT